MKDRVILHCDLNGFYASVEALSHPELKDKPMAVGGSPENRHGVILAKNELAKKQGVLTGEAIWQAVRKCPDLCIVPPNHHKYAQYSLLVNEIYGRFTDQVEPFGIDESWLDVTGSQGLFGSGKQIADTIREMIKEEYRLTVSIGVSFNKVFAKLGSDYKKPDATTVITRENYKEILFPLPVSDLLYVGKKTAQRLKFLGISTIGQLAAMDQDWLRELFGKQGEQLYRYANALDDEPVRRIDAREEVKSVGNGMTFKRNLNTIEDIKTGLRALSEMVGGRMRKQGLKCQGVQLTIKNPDFEVIDRQKSLILPTDSSQKLYDTALEIIKSCWAPGRPIRMLTLTGIGITKEEQGVQLDLFGEDAQEQKAQALDKSLDRLRGKYGSGVIRHGSLIDNDLGIE